MKPDTPQGPPLSLEAASPLQQSHDNKSGYHVGQLLCAEYCGKTFSDDTLINPHNNLYVWASNWLHTTLTDQETPVVLTPSFVLLPPFFSPPSRKQRGEVNGGQIVGTQNFRPGGTAAAKKGN